MKILLVEDNQTDARLFHELIAEFHRPDQARPAPEVVWANCLAKGLEILAEQKIDIVLLDLSLPDSHGLETLYQTQDRAGSVPIVVLTGNGEESLAVKAVRQGAQDYLMKAEVSGPSLWRATCYAVERARTLTRWEESFRIIQNLPSSLYVYSARDWKVVYCNKRFAALLGADESLISRSGMPLAAVVHPEDFGRFKQERGPALITNNNEVVSARFRIKTVQRGWQWLEVHETVYVRTNAGLPELVLGTAYPVVESQVADEAAGNELDLLRTLTDSLAEAVFAKDATGRYTYSNAAHWQSLGARSRDDVVGKTDFEFLPEHLARALCEKEEQVIRYGRIAADEEEPWAATTGDERLWRLITRAPLRDKQGRVNGLLAMSRDITAERRASRPDPVTAAVAAPRGTVGVSPQ
jgi:PAS domain S-box-containing protein